MSISSIRCGLPFCSGTEDKQTQCSAISRITAVAVGTLALVIGILVLSGLPSLNALGAPVAYLLTVGGSLALLAGLCLRCLSNKTHNQNPYREFFEACREFKRDVELLKESFVSESAAKLLTSSNKLRDIIRSPSGLSFPNSSVLYQRIFCSDELLRQFDLMVPILTKFNKINDVRKTQLITACDLVVASIDDISLYQSKS